MAQSEQEIIHDIKEHIQKEGNRYSTWYVGISKDARDRLFNDHNVSKENAWWIYRQASSTQVVRGFRITERK
jgi:predicted small metal-binding protein